MINNCAVNDCQKAILEAEVAGLRALNAELLHFIKEVAEMDDMAVERARIIARAILAKSHPSTSAQEAAS